MATEKKQPVVTLTLHDAGSWTPAGRSEVGEWLREQADDLENDGKEYSKGNTVITRTAPKA